MTVLEKNAAGRIATDSIEIAEKPVVNRRSGFRAYPLAGLAAVVICVGAVVGAYGLGLMGTGKLSRTKSLRSERSSAPGEWWSSTPVSTRRGSTRSTRNGPQDMVTFKREWEGEADP